VAEAVSLHLVVSDLDDDLGPDRRLLELAGAPAVRLGEATVGCVLQQRQDLRGDVVVRPRGDGTRADVAIFLSPSRFQRRPATTQSAVFSSLTFTTPSRDPGR